MDDDWTSCGPDGRTPLHKDQTSFLIIYELTDLIAGQNHEGDQFLQAMLAKAPDGTLDIGVFRQTVGCQTGLKLPIGDLIPIRDRTEAGGNRDRGGQADHQRQCPDQPLEAPEDLFLHQGFTFGSSTAPRRKERVPSLARRDEGNKALAGG